MYKYNQRVNNRENIVLFNPDFNKLQLEMFPNLKIDFFSLFTFVGLLT